MELVRSSSLPIAIGSPHPTVMVVEQDGAFRIRELVIDPVAALDGATASRRARSPSWMPEHYYALGKPTGAIFLEAVSLPELLEAMRTMPWPATW